MKYFKFIILFALLSLNFLSYAEDNPEMRKCINGYHITKRFISKSIKANKSLLIISYYDGQMGKIMAKSEFIYNSKKIDFTNTKSEVHSLTLASGKYKIIFGANGFIPVGGDSIELKSREQIEIQVNLDSEIQPVECDKPVIYFYSEKDVNVKVELNLKGDLGFTYPKYQNAWYFTATPSGLIKTNDNEYKYLFWEGTTAIKKSALINKGFEMGTENLLSFFESTLTSMGLSSTEQQDFITYWVPRMSKNKYVKFRFMFTSEFNVYAPLHIYPKPDVLFRLFMIWEPVKEINTNSNLIPQKLESFQRQGFTVVEWGGSEIQSNTLFSEN
jgi:hypothetical protein